MLSFWIAVASIIAFVLSTLSNLKNATSLEILRWSKLIGAAASPPSVLPLHRFEVVNVPLQTFPPRAYSDGRREDGRWGVQTRPGSRGTSRSPFLGLPTPTTPVATFHLCDDRALQHEIQNAVSVVSRPNGARSVLFPTTSRDVDVATEFPPWTPNARLAHTPSEGIPPFVEESDPISLSSTGKTSADVEARSTLKFSLPSSPISLDTATTDDPQHNSGERQPLPVYVSPLPPPPTVMLSNRTSALSSPLYDHHPSPSPYEIRPQSSSTLSSGILFEDEVARLPSSGSTLLTPLTMASVNPSIRRQPGEAVDAHAYPNLGHSKVSSRVITESTGSSCGVEAVVSISLTDSSILAETGHPNVPGDVAEALDIFVPTRLILDGDLDQLPRDRSHGIAVAVPPVAASFMRRPAVHVRRTTQSFIAVANTSPAKSISKALPIALSPLLTLALDTSAGCSSSALTSRNRSQSLSLQLVHVGGAGGGSRIPQKDDAWLVVDVKRTVIRESRYVSPRSPANIPLPVESHCGNPLPRSISLTESASLPSQHQSSIPRRVHLASSLLYQPSGLSSVSLAALPPQTNSTSRAAPVLRTSAPAQPAALPIVNVRSAATIRSEDGKQSMQCQTPLLVSELVLRGLPRESSFRSRKCKKLGKGRHEERNGKTVTRVSAVKKGKWCDCKNKKDLSDQAGRRVMSRWETQCLRRVAGQEHLLEIIEAWEDIKAGVTFIRTEFINGYSLADWIEWSPRGNWRNCAPVAAILYQIRMDKSHAWIWVLNLPSNFYSKVNQGLLELESCGVTHADIKLGNIMKALGVTEGFVPSEARRRVGAIHGSRDVFAVGQTMNLLFEHKCWRTPLQPWETELRRIVTPCCDEDHIKRLTPQRILTELYRACAQHGAGSEGGSWHIIRRQLEIDQQELSEGRARQEARQEPTYAPCCQSPMPPPGLRP
ncbi:hypothetical protein FRB96_006568 [Tulasnella sp. 330]|nr:hypothetical protein FRB96_006568 [Tulasnella sp. 330]